MEAAWSCLQLLRLCHEWKNIFKVKNYLGVDSRKYEDVRKSSFGSKGEDENYFSATPNKEREKKNSG